MPGKGLVACTGSPGTVSVVPLSQRGAISRSWLVLKGFLAKLPLLSSSTMPRRRSAPLLTRRCDLYSVTARSDTPCSSPTIVRQRRLAATGYQYRVARNQPRAIRFGSSEPIASRERGGGISSGTLMQILSIQ